jgi:hypothetical protein
MSSREELVTDSEGEDDVVLELSQGRLREALRVRREYATGTLLRTGSIDLELFTEMERMILDGDEIYGTCLTPSRPLADLEIAESTPITDAQEIAEPALSSHEEELDLMPTVDTHVLRLQTPAADPNDSRDPIPNVVDRDVADATSIVEESWVPDAEAQNIIETTTTTDFQDVVTHITPTVDAQEVADLNKEAMYYGRGARRRNRSFYQQHIYTIDSVGYILRLDLEQATDLVKKNPELIEKFHNGTLRRFLTKDKDSATKSTKSTTKKRTTAKITEESNESQQYDMDINQLREQEEEDLYTENNSTDESSEDDSDHEEALTVTFRGKTYNSMEELSRVSKLPMSYFSRENSKGSKQRVVKRKRAEEYRVGVAKKKKTRTFGEGSDDLNSFEAIFTTGEDSQENDFNTTEPHHELEIILEQESDDDIQNERETSMFDEDAPTFYRSRTIHDEIYMDGVEVVEERGFAADPMLASAGPRSHKMRKINASNSAKTKKFKRRSIGSNTLSIGRVSRPPLSSNSEEPKKRSNKASKPRQSTLFDTHKPNIASACEKFTIASMFGDNIDDKKEMRVTQLDGKDRKRSKKKTKNYFSVQPHLNSVLARQAYRSTVVYETLGDEYAVLSKKSVAQGPTIIEIDDYNDQVDRPSTFDIQFGFKSHFMNSDTYKILFEGSKYTDNHEFQVSFGKKTLTFSKLVPNVEKSFRELFEVLSDTSTLRSTNPRTFMENCHRVIAFCYDLDVNPAKSLVTMVDNFRFKMESFIRTKGSMRDIEFYCLSLCYMMYYCSHKVFERNYLIIFDFKSKAHGIVSLFMQFVSYIDGRVLNSRLNDQSLLSEAVSLLFLDYKDITWKAIEEAEWIDLVFLKNLCARYEPGVSLWGIVIRVIQGYLKSGNLDSVRYSLMVIQDFISLGWKIDENVLLVIYECIKQNKFKNFPGDPSNPVIMSKYGISKDTVVNMYLNFLADYGKSFEKFPGRFLERIVPVSKVSSPDSIVLCNRMNILICLSIVSKRNFDMRFFELASSRDFMSKFAVQKILQALELLVIVNNNNKLVTNFMLMEQIIESFVEDEGFIKLWGNFINKIGFHELLPKTQKNFLSVLAKFLGSKTFFSANYEIVKTFISEANDQPTLQYLMETFEGLNPVLFPVLWLSLSGKLTTSGLKNWSNLIHFNNFDDEPQIYSFILNHSGVSTYSAERETFVISFIKNLTKPNYSPSMNSFIKEFAKVDKKLLSCQNLLIQTNRLQITINFIFHLLRNEAPGSRSRFLSVLINSMKYNYDQCPSESKAQYASFVKKATEFINLYGSDYASTIRAFEILCSEFKVTKRASQSESINVLNLNGNINESLKFLEEKLISCIKLTQDFSKVISPIVLGHSQKSLIISESIVDSKLFVLCCSISSHIECLKLTPSCWIFLSELTKALMDIVEADNNIHGVDFFCLLKTVQLFPFILGHRNSRFEPFEILTLRNIYRVLITLFFRLDGSNDLDCFLKLVTIFTSQDTIYEIVATAYFPQYLIKTPEFIKDMVIRSNITGNDKQISIGKLRDELDDIFNKFVSCVDGASMGDDEYGLIIDN